MEKSKIKIILIVIIILIICAGIFGNTKEKKELDTEIPIETSKDNTEEKPICDGIKIVNDCEKDGLIYSTYKYHPAEEEKSHIEIVTTYEQIITGYCTLCNDGTYSPTCATGRGACSHHGGVAQWNAPVYSEVAKKEEKKIIDSPATPEYWEKVLKED